MNISDRVVFAWVWIIGVVCLGTGLSLSLLFLPDDSDWTRNGSGTALLLIAASFLFVVVFESLAQINWRTPVHAATSLTAVFGYAGTATVLMGENPLLFALILITTFYIGWVGALFVVIARIVRTIFGTRS